MQKNTILVLVSLAVLFSGCIGIEEKNLFKFDEAITAVTIGLENGLLSVEPSLDGSIRVEQVLRFSTRRPLTEVRILDGVLQLEGQCKGFQFVCEVEYIAKIPANVSLLAETETANIEVRGIEGPLSLRSETGNIDASDALAEVLAETEVGNIILDRITGDIISLSEVGNITISDVSGTIEVSSEVGDIILTAIRGDIFAKSEVGNLFGEDLASFVLELESEVGNINTEFLSSPQSVVASSEVGNITLTVPVEEYQINTQSEIGSIQIQGLVDVPGAERSISVSSEVGNISVLGR